MGQRHRGGQMGQRHRGGQMGQRHRGGQMGQVQSEGAAHQLVSDGAKHTVEGPAQLRALAQQLQVEEWGRLAMVLQVWHGVKVHALQQSSVSLSQGTKCMIITNNLLCMRLKTAGASCSQASG
jgi:hypothetical protein